MPPNAGASTSSSTSTARVLGHGIVTDRGGKVLRRFVVTMRCSWIGDTGTLDEDVQSTTTANGSNASGAFAAPPDGSYTARADDVVGEAVGPGAGLAPSTGATR